MTKDTSITDFPKLVQNFFCKRLMNQQDVSKRTIAAYRDTFKLLFVFIKEKYGNSPSDINLSDLNVDLILDFLNHLENDRKNCVRTRNARLAAIRSFFQFAALEVPEQLSRINRILAIPMKQFNRPYINYLSNEEINSILTALNQQTWAGRRDFAMFTTLYNTGARVSELIFIRIKDLIFSDSSSAITLHGKGRKERTIPLWKSTTKILKRWRKELPDNLSSPLFPNKMGSALSRSGVEFRLRVATKQASKKNESLSNKTVTPHIIRHSTAMHMLQSGVDLSVIALWLGHESIQTTHTYMESDLQMKEKALSMVDHPSNKGIRFRANDKLLHFLETLLLC